MASLTPQGALLRARLTRVRNHLVHRQKDSVALVAVILFGLVCVIALASSVSYQSFRFTEGFIFGADLNAKLVSLLFFALLVLVTLSTIIISWVTLFIARETEFFFQHPIPPRTVLLAKTAEAVSFSTWASLFLCMPVLVSFGLVRSAPAGYYAFAFVVLATFLVFSGLVGTTVTLLLAPLLRRLATRGLVATALVVLAGLSWAFLWSLEFWDLDGENNLLILDRFMSGLRAMQSPWSPSYWASAAVLSAAGGSTAEVWFHEAVLLANTLIFLPFLVAYGSRFYGREWLARRDKGRARGERSRSRCRRPRRMGRTPIGALVAKDLLLFTRDPAQLSQSLLFVLLMVIYSLSLLRFPDFVASRGIKLFIHFANIGAVAMILSSFTSRFLFPLISLEGRAFWIVGLAPMPRARLLHQKALFGLVVCLILALPTITISNLALQSPPGLFATAVWTLVLASICLTSLSSGLGAAYPSFAEDNPARIAAGLGGTLNFFASALAVALLVAIEGLPYLVGGAEPAIWLVVSAHALALLFSGALSWFVLALGGRALARCEL